VTGLLTRSERIQGHRTQIDELRRAWEDRCRVSSDEEESSGKSRGKRKGQDKGD